MFHIIFDRPNQTFAVWRKGEGLVASYAASGDAWGDGVSGPYGHDYPIAPGHYLLGPPQPLNPPLMAEGSWQIPVLDLGNDVLSRLASAQLASEPDGVLVNIGGVVLPRGGLARYGRSAVFVHGGGSNLGEPSCYDEEQPLCKTEGCPRMHNGDLATFAALVDENIAGNVFVFSCVGDPAELGQ